MDYDKIIHPEVQAKVRDILKSILIEDNIGITELAVRCDISYVSLYKFLKKKNDLGEIILRKLLHFVTRKKQYKIEDIINV